MSFDFKKDPFASARPMLRPEMLSQKMPGSDMTIGDMVKQQEKMLKDFYGANDNPIEIAVLVYPLQGMLDGILGNILVRVGQHLLREIMMDDCIQAVILIIKIIIKGCPDDAGLIADLLDRNLLKDFFKHQFSQ